MNPSLGASRKTSLFCDDPEKPPSPSETPPDRHRVHEQCRPFVFVGLTRLSSAYRHRTRRQHRRRMEAGFMNAATTTGAACRAGGGPSRTVAKQGCFARSPHGWVHGVPGRPSPCTMRSKPPTLPIMNPAPRYPRAQLILQSSSASPLMPWLSIMCLRLLSASS